MEEESQLNTVPKYFTLKSRQNGRYLRYINDDKTMHGFLTFSGTHVVSPFAKFEVEKAKEKSNKGLVHIRCCYNNKYWVRWSEKSKYIVAKANEPNEDRTKFSSTLFEPTVFNNDQKIFRFKHVQLNHYVELRYHKAKQFQDALFANGLAFGFDKSDLFTIFDWSTLFVLPKHVAFKGNNGHYLKVHSSGTKYLEFSGSDVGDPRVGNQIFTTADGHVRIKNDYLGKFWIRDPNWILVKASESDFDDPNNLFWPVRLGDGQGIALRNRGNDMFCKSLSKDGKNNCLNAAVDSISPEAKLQIEELVISRTIYDVNFRVLDARFYNETPITMTSKEMVNRSSEPELQKLKLRYEDTKSSTWTNSVGKKLGMKMSIETGTPEISSQEIEVSAEFKEEYTWGETKETKSRMEVEHHVTVPPNSRVIAKVLSTKGFCDIPYSYTQRDVLTNGKVIIQHFDDGVYIGSNCYNYTFSAEQEDL
uniref:Agglutinin domain-containing protein n=1 Tax=Cucumis sativus TaxID=3659 RepID=A0A0A0KEX2_CUCSA